MADIFADLLAQYTGSIAVVQPLLPSRFAPLPALASETTQTLSDDQTALPPETPFFPDETLSLTREESKIQPEADPQAENMPARVLVEPAFLPLQEHIPEQRLDQKKQQAQPVQKLRFYQQIKHRFQQKNSQHR